MDQNAAEIQRLSVHLQALAERVDRSVYPPISMHGKQLTREEEMQVLQDCNRLQALISRKVTVEHIEAAAYLLSSLKIPANIDPNVIALNYSIALADTSEHTVKQAIKDVICGKAKGLSKTFMPTGAELAEYYRNLKSNLGGGLQ